MNSILIFFFSPTWWRWLHLMNDNLNFIHTSWDDDNFVGDSREPKTYTYMLAKIPRNHRFKTQCLCRQVVIVLHSMADELNLMDLNLCWKCFSFFSKLSFLSTTSRSCCTPQRSRHFAHDVIFIHHFIVLLSIVGDYAKQKTENHE